MDIYCPKCGEPWEMDSLHEEAQERYGIDYYTNYPAYGYVAIHDRKKNPEYNEDDYQKVYKEVKRQFQSEGCKTFSFASECTAPNRSEMQTDSTFGLTANEAAAALYDVLGDDMDGAAAMLEDMGF